MPSLFKEYGNEWRNNSETKMRDSLTMRTTSAVWLFESMRNFSKLIEGVYSLK